MELKRCNAIADVEYYLRSMVDSEFEVTVTSYGGYYYVYDWGELTAPNEVLLYEGRAGMFHCLTEIH